MHNACNCNNQRVPFKGFAIDNKDGKFHEWEHSRHAMGEYDVVIDTHFSGICHTDIHFAFQEFVIRIFTSLIAIGCLEFILWCLGMRLLG
ncbi:zinc-dependent alcohol dehydrogenase [Helicobacter pylori]|uniref:Zinc-dependent alcohol dehydrogenase n=1 Tax=Helicobacter pylori TaxID=210 RepID=A0A377RLQ4_HELPX|nr:zinc-dependent alcohol dehydrogenase [Helicobacter pylori]